MAHTRITHMGPVQSPPEAAPSQPSISTPSGTTTPVTVLASQGTQGNAHAQGQLGPLPPEGGPAASVRPWERADWWSDDEAACRVPMRCDPPATTPPTQPTPTETPDQRLARIQARAVASAERENAAGVTEDLGDNRGTRVGVYQREAGINPGQQWCGAFAAHNYRQAATEEGASFTGARRLESDRKARNYFLYRNADRADGRPSGRDDTLRAQHEGEGSARRYMTLRGSAGDREATEAQGRGGSHEAYDSPEQMPIRPGDTVIEDGHVAMVRSYDPRTGEIQTIEGNNGDRVTTGHINVRSPNFRGIGRPAAGDFQPAGRRR